MARRRRTPAWVAVPRQDGRRFVVTGASSGIGLQTARILAAFGAEVVLAVRNPDKGAAVAPGPAGKRRGTPARRRRPVLGARVRRRDRRPVDVLVNNAGVMGVPFARTADGFETQIATNHLGHFALANLLLPRLTDRVVVVGSASHRSGDLDVDDLSGSAAATGPTRRTPSPSWPTCCSSPSSSGGSPRPARRCARPGAHPGYTSTGIQGGTGNRAFTWLSDLGNALLGMPPWQGALPTVYAATMDVPGNTYVGPHRARELNGWPTLVGRSTRRRPTRTSPRRSGRGPRS